MDQLTVERPVSVDIVISTYQRGSSIDATIASIRQSLFSRFTLWVLDQSHDDRTEECVRKHADADQRVRYFRVPVRGLSATRNAGSTLGSAPYILFTNDDIQVEPGWIEACVQELQHPEHWAVFGRVLPGGTQPQDRPFVLAVKEATQPETYDSTHFNVGFGHGHNMGVRRERFEQLHGFDTLLGAGSPMYSWDELDFGFRLVHAGGKIAYAPDAVAYHDHWVDWPGLLKSYRGYGIGVGATVGKYLRCGKLGAITLLLSWWLRHGLRQILSGVIRHPSFHRVRLVSANCSTR